MTTQSRKLLIPMDGGKHSEYAYDWYVKYFYRPKDEIIILHCIDPAVAATYKFQTKASISATISGEEEDVNPVVAKLQKLIANCGIRSSLVKVQGNKPGEAIIKAIDDQRVDMVLMGNKDMTATKRAMMGSVSEYVVYHSPVPVLVVKQ